MGGKKKKYNARFPPARIKKIMQTDEEVGKIAAAVPVVISRALELFLESIITESVNIANDTSAKTLSSSHIKSVIQSNPAFDFLKAQVTLVPDLNPEGAESSGTGIERLTGVSGGTRPAHTSTTHLSAPQSSSSTDNAQQSSTGQPKKRARAAASTATASQDDPDKPKRKRGRPPKVRPEDKPVEVKAEATVTSRSHSLPIPTLTPDQISLDHTGKKEVKSEPVLATHSLAPQVSSLSLAAPRMELTKPAADVDTHSPESIFHTNTTVGLPPTAKSELQRQAHTASSVARFYDSTCPLNLSYTRNNPMTAHSMHVANLSPTSQPMDLSNKIDPAPRAFMPYTPPETKNLVPANYLAPSNGAGIPVNPYTAPAVVGDADDYDV